ncbi:MAG TPA: NADH-quinone oxidoreductase subunit N [Vicinamibacterales bacterium]|nr:NADH-quinone oxidoreductase subunit N [Vicinamibacterales bacterium]
MPEGFSASDFYYLLPELVMTGGSLVLLGADAIVRGTRRRLLTGLALLTIVATAAALVPMADVNIVVARGTIAVDTFAFFFKIVFLLAALLAILMSFTYLEVEGVRPGEYYFLVLCATLGMMIMAGGVDLITIFIGLETMAVSFYVLAGYLKPNRRSNEAAVKYFLLGAFSLGILLYGMSLLYAVTGTTQLGQIATALASGGGGILLALAAVLVVAGVGFKIAAVPFHMWAPDVYEGSPTPVAAFLSVGSKAASFAMLLRIFVEGLPAFSASGLSTWFGMPIGWTTFFYVLAVITMTVGNLAALTQSNMKRLLAYSSIAHAGYVLIGVVAISSGSIRGITATLIYLFIYAFMQLGAFAIVTMMRRRDTIGDELKDLSGLYFRSPAAAIAMLLFMLSLGGIPPTAGFMGKFWVFGAAIEAGYVWLAVIGVLNSAISLYYYIRVVVFIWTREEAAGSALSLSPALATVLVVAVVGTLALGIYPAPLFELAEASAQTLGHAGAALTFLR